MKFCINTNESTLYINDCLNHVVEIPRQHIVQFRTFDWFGNNSHASVTQKSSKYCSKHDYKNDETDVCFLYQQLVPMEMCPASLIYTIFILYLYYIYTLFILFLV